MAEAATRIVLEERRFPRLVRAVQTLRRWRVLTLSIVVVGICTVFVIDMLVNGWFIVGGFYLLPLAVSAVVLRLRPTLYLSTICLILSAAVFLAQGVRGIEPVFFFLFEVLACIGLLVLAHLLSQVDRISTQAGMRARYAEAVADITGMSGRGESGDQIVAFALERIRREIEAEVALVLRLREGEWSCVAAHGVELDIDDLSLPFAVLPGAAQAIENDSVLVGGGCVDLSRLPDEADPMIRRGAEALANLRSCLSVPLRALGEELGVVVLGRTQEGLSYAPDQVRFAESVAGYTAVALESARLLRELAAREKDLSLVVASSLDFAASLELGEVLRAVIARLVAALSVSECELYAVDLERRTLVALAGMDVAEPQMASTPGSEYDMQEWSSTLVAVNASVPLVVYGTDDERLSVVERHYFEQRGFSSLLSLPLKARDRVIGLVEMFDRAPGRRFTEADIALAEAVCQFAGLAIDNASLYEDQRSTAERNDRLIQQLQRLMGIAMRLNHLQTQPDAQRLLDTVVRSGAGLLDALRVAIVSVEEGAITVHALHDAEKSQEADEVLEGPRPVPMWLGGFVPPKPALSWRPADTPMTTRQDGHLIVPVSSPQIAEEAYLVFDDKRRGTFGAEDELLASTLAIQLAASLTNTQTYRREYEIAETLQNALQLEPPRVGGLDVGLRYKAATEAARVGGDFYDLVSLGPGRLMVCVGDICGKGLTAAAQTALVRYMLRAYVAEGSPGEALSRLNSTLMTQEENLPFATVLVAYFDVPRRVLEYAVAGHPRPVVLGGGHRVTVPVEGGYPVGLFRGAVYPTNHTVLPPDATVVMHTDGLLEARRNGKMFGERRLGQAVRANAEGSAQEIAEGLMKAVERYAGRVRDDAAVVVIRFA
jgi:serine phosphatase RsbU (regulator of sigma subunit)/transcriptional regulator with GAF, ATPase, and Fis domain